jgi:hypothetical protein
MILHPPLVSALDGPVQPQPHQSPVTTTRETMIDTHSSCLPPAAARPRHAARAETMEKLINERACRATAAAHVVGLAAKKPWVLLASPRSPGPSRAAGDDRLEWEPHARTAHSTHRTETADRGQQPRSRASTSTYPVRLRPAHRSRDPHDEKVGARRPQRCSSPDTCSHASAGLPPLAPEPCQHV